MGESVRVTRRQSGTQPRRNPREFIAVRRFAAVGSPAARLLLIPHKVSSLRCGTLRGPRTRVVKMRRCSLRSSFLRNYRKALSFSLRVDTSGQERRTEGIAIVTRSVNRVIPPPRGPRVGGGNQDNPRTNSLIERPRTRRISFGDGTTRRSAKLSQGAALLKVAARKVSAEQRRGSK